MFIRYQVYPIQILIRTHLVEALYKNLIGPKGGHDEVIEQPFGTYQAGILTSCFHSEPLNDTLISDPLEKGFGKKKSTDPMEFTHDDDVLWPDTELGMDGSFTLGVTFVIEGESPKIQICSTWGRYELSNIHPPEMRIFRRKPNYHLTDWIDISKNEHKPIKLIESTDDHVITKEGAELHIKTSKQREKCWAVQIFLVNNTRYKDKDEDDRPKRQDETHRIFQPQMRINVDKNSKIGHLGNDDQDYDQDEFLTYYRQRTKARGFQCGAVWKKVDPESCKDETGFRRFSWIDGNSGIVPEKIREQFTRPHVRTEYIPSYSILQPDMKGGEYDAEFLSEQWDPQIIKEHIESLSHDYEGWIAERRSELEMNKYELPRKLINKGFEKLDECDRSLQEIKMGIDLVCSNERVRLAFCFMNKVMSYKYECENRNKSKKMQKLFWRKFQMGFILQSLRGVTGLDDHSPADVLWFPTGGGKTEAYLGITVFAMAYRRLLDPTDIKNMYGQNLNNDGGVNIISRYTLRLLTIQQFQRALGAIVLADLLRVKNWMPTGLGNQPKFVNEFLDSNARRLWGKSRFSIGLWIGTASTPSRFAYQTGHKGRQIANAEGALLSHKKYNGNIRGDPAQVKKCPICDNILSFSERLQDSDSNKFDVSWIIKTKKSLVDLGSISKVKFEHPHKTIQLKEKPQFLEIIKLDDGYSFVRVKMSLTIRDLDIRKAIDDWWDNFVNKNFGSKDCLTSTRASRPGYFFIQKAGNNRPHDFAIYCTNEECVLNKTEWYEEIGNNTSSIPDPFRITKTNISRSVPISAFTIDEQIYSQCPTFVIATSDKFANLPWDYRCASIFGNVNCKHGDFGYGRKDHSYAPLLNHKGIRIKPDLPEYTPITRFIPPSLIIQDELHLIEGPLGSMVGIYEMAIDVMCTMGECSPKYISSSATIKEAKKQTWTIFRRDARIFPPPGVDSSNNFFANSEEDISCVKETAGRLYIGICSAKSVFELPIKICAILMSTVHKIRENPEFYGIDVAKVDEELDPYWTYISYFSDLQLMSRFSGFYRDDIARDIKKFSIPRIGTSKIKGVIKFSKGVRLIPITLEKDFDVYGVSIYTHNTKGRISTGIFCNPLSKQPLILFDPKKCSKGENIFIHDKIIHKGHAGEILWIAVANDDSNILFRTTESNQRWFENIHDFHDFNVVDAIDDMKETTGDIVQVELTGKQRILAEENKIEMSSETKSEDLPEFLTKLQKPMLVDALLTSPVFGTGIDIDRLGLINIMTQPKTTSSYIQSTGRVGRQKPALVVTWLLPRRARDLDYYENFIGYHRKIHSYVEPITANPFSDESLKLNLGPIMVAILRNASSISNVPISEKWLENETGAKNIIVHTNGNSPEINAIRNVLKQIATFDLLPPARKNQRFANILDNQLNKWLSLVNRLKDKEIIYGERNPERPVEKDVILGTPFHESRGFEAAFPNTRNSLRNTESTSIFYHADIKTSIRPSQFITRYGPGSFLPADACSIVSPSISEIIADLNKPLGNFADEVDGKKELKKIEIMDPNMVKMLYRYNEKKEYEKIKIFKMPTNASLNSKEHEVTDNDKLYNAKLFPEWGVCSRHLGDRILAKITYDPRKNIPAIRCPGCKDQFGYEYSTAFSSSRFVMACKDGHMSDVSWFNEIHRKISCSNQADDRQRVFIWDETGSGDNINFKCHGVWRDEKFIETTCNAQIKYSLLRHLSNEGQLKCSGKFVEESNSNLCHSTPIIARKSMLSLRSPIVLSSLKIQYHRHKLYNKLVEYSSDILFAKKHLEKHNKNWKSDDLAEMLTSSTMPKGIRHDICNTNKNDLLRVIEEFEQNNTGTSKKESLSETENLKEELRSLENGVIEGARQTKNSDGGNNPYIKYPISWYNRKHDLSFEAMPFNDIAVTMVQTGYTREISEIVRENRPESEPEKAIRMRLGTMVHQYSMHEDKSTGICWYLGNQNIGEGIFIHLDPVKHKNANEVFKHSKNETLIDWENFHEKISESVEAKLRRKDLKEEERDSLDNAKTRSNPLFVWWHSLAHQIITGLAIDSGFTTTALNERIYCMKNSDGTYSAGILIYVSAAGSVGTLGGLTSLADDEVLPKIIERALDRITICSNDPVCSDRKFRIGRHRGAACHSCILAPETTCGYLNKFLDRNLVRGSTP